MIASSTDTHPHLPVRLDVSWLGVVRHGQSTANVAWADAVAAGRHHAGIDHRDADVTLTATGREHAAGVGRWLAGLDAATAPQIVVVSPYRRCQQTLDIALATPGAPAPELVVTDERLRDQELGVLEWLTDDGITARYPEEAERRARTGRLYHRPPGGESWADVALRLRSLFADITDRWPGRRVLLVGHDLTARLARYLVEGLSEADLMASTASDPVANGSLTAWDRRDGHLTLVARHTTDHLA
ncbi:histidine phosphatase family protein [Actinocatenispora rupis]|uniref:Phosphoglycerate mutase n=1 Tax=Actinocatenispora rupis TaxID=519421 RepID=A0A8J3J0Y6_9ACTN|nr:histidine phosphatase family protein [Actinocatenispora rupis]GID12188.1 phosphoglycerate mutase [Actinocatenispora rupis]